MSLKRLLRSITRDLLRYADLQFNTPSGLNLYVPDRGAWSSAGEVYFSRIYDPFFRHLHGVRNWVDLGCNQGFFSCGLRDYLYLQENAVPKTNVFLGDADEVCVARVCDAIKRNKLDWRCEQTVIGPPDAIVSFKRHKDSMASNIFNKGYGRVSQKATFDISARLAQEKDLFDLLKIDVEGAEQFLFKHHTNFLKRFRYSLCEWHSPAFSGQQLRAAIEQLNFRVVEVHVLGIKRDPALGETWNPPMGTVLWENPAPTS